MVSRAVAQDTHTHADAVVCGDDKTNVPKPAPDNILNICKHFKGAGEVAAGGRARANETEREGDKEED